MSSTAGLTDQLLRPLEVDACWELLATTSLGRVAYVDRNGPIVLPFNYVVQDRALWLRTASYSQLAIHLPGELAALEVDDVDQESRAGWSVLARGRVEHVMDPHPDLPLPWAGGVRTMVFCLRPTHVTGRVLLPRNHDATGRQH